MCVSCRAANKRGALTLYCTKMSPPPLRESRNERSHKWKKKKIQMVSKKKHKVTYQFHSCCTDHLLRPSGWSL